MIALTAAMSAGCIEEMENFSGVITKDQAEANAENFLPSTLNGLTASMSKAFYLGSEEHIDFGLPSIHLMTEAMLEDCFATAECGYDMYFDTVYAAYISESDWAGTYYWTAYYKWIKLTNDLIAAIDPETEDPVAQYYLAQAYAYRASFYLDLARLYEPKQNEYVPVDEKLLDLTVSIVTEKTTAEEAKNNPRVKKDRMYEFILEDLTTAETLFTSSQKTGDFSQASLDAVNGLFAKTYLEMGYWGDSKSAEYFANAAAYAKKAQAGYSPLTAAQWHDPATGFNSGGSNESWIWGLTLSSSNTNNLLNFTAMISTEAMFGYGPLGVKGAQTTFYEQMSEGDFRKDSFIDMAWEGFADFYTELGMDPVEEGIVNKHDYKFAGSAAEQEEYLETLLYSVVDGYPSVKFRPAGGAVNNSTQGALADHPLMRVEEMMFIEMEAVAQKDGYSAAVAMLESYMNDYRMKEGFTYACPETVTDLGTFITELMLQKRIEFWGEGVMFFDYKRLGLPTNRITFYGGAAMPVLCQQLEGRSPQWNVCIPEDECNNNLGIPQEMNNPDPSAFRMML